MSAARPAVGRRTVVYLGISQLVCWGISYYLIGVFGEQIVADLGWSRTLVYGGFSIALLVMGLVSPLVGRLIDRLGGARVMSLGSVLIALGTAGLALAHGITAYYAAWICLGVAMRATLYDAAFATLARISGPEASRPIAQVTLLGGLASTCFWPIGHLLADAFGWRGALLAYALIALATLPLHLAIPKGRYDAARQATARPPPEQARGRVAPALLYAVIIAATNALNSGMSAHMIGMLTGLGLAASAAVWIASLRGIGQSLARLAQVLFGRRLHPLDLNLAAALVLTLCFVVGFAGGWFLTAAVAFAFFYGAGNGILTITRGTLPLVLFDHRTYGAFVGKLLVPSFLLSALAPFAYAAVIEAFGVDGGLWLSLALAGTTLAGALGLKLVGRPADKRSQR
jgi:predicted MFS family arabinose efflux permease